MTKRSTTLLCALLTSLLGCKDSALIHNPSIERWCGEHPCDWEVEGTVRRVGTWHPDDYAVELVSNDARISQLNSQVDYRSSDCFAFTLVAKIARGATAYLELDFLDDGTAEFSQELPVSDWNRLTFNVTAPDWYKGVRFIVRKAGPGQVILAELQATNHDGGCIAPPVELDDRPAGALCARDDECADQRCENRVCASCSADADCSGDEVCGRVLVTGGVERACVAQGSANFGEVCASDAQCDTGFCNNEACSECDGNRCDDGRDCAPAAGSATNPVPAIWPSLCDPGSGARQSGELCTSDRDCQSDNCIGNDLTCPLPCDQHSDPHCTLNCMPQISGGHCQ